MCKCVFFFFMQQGHTAVRSKFKLKIQSESHQKNVRTKNKLTMKKKHSLAIRNEKKREPKVCLVNNSFPALILILWLYHIFQVKSIKINTKKDDMTFTKLVNKYKNKMSTPETLKKWYDSK